MGVDVVEWVLSADYRSIQFNAVVETNIAAVRLWRSLEFEILATVPEAFDPPVHGLAGLHVMIRRLSWSSSLAENRSFPVNADRPERIEPCPSLDASRR